MLTMMSSMLKFRAPGAAYVDNLTHFVLGKTATLPLRFDPFAHGLHVFRTLKTP
jgi:hypothetical protein